VAQLAVTKSIFGEVVSTRTVNVELTTVLPLVVLSVALNLTVDSPGDRNATALQLTLEVPLTIVAVVQGDEPTFIPTLWIVTAVTPPCALEAAGYPSETLASPVNTTVGLLL